MTKNQAMEKSTINVSEENIYLCLKVYGLCVTIVTDQTEDVLKKLVITFYNMKQLVAF